MRPNPNYSQLEQIVKEEPSLSVKLLRYLNSAMFGLRAKVESIKQALAMLGDRQIRQWASLVALTSLGDDKPAATLSLCLIRARFCEELCPHVNLTGRDLDLFFLGLLSGIDGLVDRPLGEMLADMPVPTDIKAALMGSSTTFGTIYGLVLACERGKPNVIKLLADKIKVPEELVTQLYCDAIAWADKIMQA
jgi:EAL and modified HD-GYP domain-containing signal transduction protein